MLRSPVTGVLFYLFTLGMLVAVLWSAWLAFVANRKTRLTSDPAWEKRENLWLELTVIFLIGFEVALSLVSMRADAIEADHQVETLSRVDKNMKTTADLMQDVRQNTSDQKQTLLDLTKKQAQSLEALNASVKTMRTMSDALRDQLAIIKDEQAERRAEQAKKPHLALMLNGQILSDSNNVTLNYLDKANGTEDFAFWLVNNGDATATGGVVRISTDPHFTFTCDCKTEPWRDFREIGEPGITVLFDVLRPKYPLPITLHADRGAQTYVRFYVSGFSDQIPPETQITVFTLRGGD